MLLNRRLAHPLSPATFCGLSASRSDAGIESGKKRGFFPEEAAVLRLRADLMRDLRESARPA